MKNISRDNISRVLESEKSKMKNIMSVGIIVPFIIDLKKNIELYKKPLSI